MGDMGDIFNAMRSDKQRHRAEMLSKADTTGWTQNTPWHFSRVFGGRRMEWWPSGGKAMLDGRMIYGHRKVNKKIAELAALEPKP